LELKIGNITKEKVDVVVNAANGSLMGDGGVDGAIHRAAGSGLLEACKRIRNEELNGEPLATGGVVMTDGYHLPASHIIHTVGPVWGEDEEEKNRLLVDCYWNALDLANEKGLRRISFPSISTGVYRFPVGRAAVLAIKTISEFIQEHDSPSHVTMVL